jgi:hypothetical protein
MLTWEGISYVIKGFISNTKLVILGLANSSESPYCLPDPCSHSETQNTLDSSANVKSAIITGMQYVQPCLSKNPKYTFYTINNSLTVAY